MYRFLSVLQQSKLFVLVFLVVSGNLFAQDNYQPIATEGAHYLIRVENSGTYWSDSTWYGYALQGDTVIENQIWKKVYCRWLELHDGQLIIVWDSLHAVVRDEINEQKVYAIKFRHNPFGNSCPLNEEFLLYDFSLSVGDPITSCVWGSFQISCTSIQYAQFFGSEHRCLITDYWEMPVIEGIGTIAGLFELYTVNISSGTETPPYNYPVLEDYCIGSDFECGQFYSAVDNSFLPGQPDIKYNRFSHSFVVTWNGAETGDCDLSLFSIDGKLIFQKQGDVSEVSFDGRMGNSAGLYIVRLRYGKHTKSFKIEI